MRGSGLGVLGAVRGTRAAALELDREQAIRFLGVGTGVDVKLKVPGAVLPIMFM